MPTFTSAYLPTCDRLANMPSGTHEVYSDLNGAYLTTSSALPTKRATAQEPIFDFLMGTEYLKASEASALQTRTSLKHGTLSQKESLPKRFNLYTALTGFYLPPFALVVCHCLDARSTLCAQAVGASHGRIRATVHSTCGAAVCRIGIVSC